MRSRYTAYAQGRVEYIAKTMKGKAAIGFNLAEAKAWAQAVEWQGLEVIDSQVDGAVGYVTFSANYRCGGKEETLTEKSEFHEETGEWFYVDGVVK